MTPGEIKRFFGYKDQTRYSRIAVDIGLPVDSTKRLVLRRLRTRHRQIKQQISSSRIVRQARTKILTMNPVSTRTTQTGNMYQRFNIGGFTNKREFLLNVEKYRPYFMGQKINFEVGINDGSKRNTGSFKYFNQAVRDFDDFVAGWEENYEGEVSVVFNNVSLVSITPNTSMIGMGAARSHQQANNKWFIYSPKSRENCLYHSIQVCKNPKCISKYISNNTSLVDDSKKLKRRVNPSNKMFGDDRVLQEVTNFLKTDIIVYDNLYREHKVFKPVKYQLRNKKKPLEIRYSNRNHFEALIRKGDLPNDFIISKEDKVEEKLENNDDIEVIKKHKKRKDKFTNLGAWDIETYCLPNGNFNTYAIGFTDGEKYISFWGEDSTKQFLQYLYDNSEKLNGICLYAHNGGKFDNINIQRIIMESEIWKIDTQKNDMIELDGRILKLCIYNDKGHFIHFRDSVAMLSGSLDKLCKSFQISNNKGKEDHEAIEKFLNNNYSIEGLKRVFPTLEEYLKLDCICLLEIILKFNDIVYSISHIEEWNKNKAGGIRLVDCLTAASLSKNLFYQKYYYNNVFFLNDFQDNFIRNSYGGGRTEAFYIGKVEKKLWYFDFTSLYPSVCVNKLPVGKPEYVKKFNKPESYSFIRCRVRTTENGYKHKPLHYVKKDGKMIFPHFDTWTTMTLYSAEIQYGLSRDLYEYELLDGYRFQGGYLLKDFMLNGFNRKAEAKSNGDKAMAQTWKIIINSGYGFWGLRSKNRDCVKLINDPTFNPSYVYQYIETDKLVNESNYSGYTTVRIKNDIPVRDFNVSVSAAISSLARIKITELIHDIELEGKKVYYCDTDSVITDCDIYHNKKLQSKFMWDYTGDELGSLKNEAHDLVGVDQQKRYNDSVWFDTAYIYGAKYYALKGENMEICKLKGYKQSDNKLSIDDYIAIENGTMLEQEQTQFICSKSMWLDENNPYQMVKNKIQKTFKVNYLKGNVCEDGNVEPFVF